MMNRIKITKNRANTHFFSGNGHNMKGAIEALGMTILFLVILVGVVTIAVLILFFTFNHQAKFSNDYAVVSGKAYSVSEVLVARSYETKTGEELVFRELIGDIPDEYKEPIVKAGNKYEISPNLIAAIFKCGEHSIYTSSSIAGGYSADTARNDLSARWPNINGGWSDGPMTPYGKAKGPFQFLDSSWQTYGDDCNSDGTKDVRNIHDAACAAANHLKTRMSWPAKYDDKVKTTIWYYNNANWYVDRVYSCYIYLQGGAGFFSKDVVDDRNAFDHSIAMAITGNDEKALSAGFVSEIPGFMDRYGFGFYSIDVSKIAVDRNDRSENIEVVQRVSKAAVFCGSYEENCLGGEKGKCIAYCEPGSCSPGRDKYKKGSEVCGKAICCSEKYYDWANMRYTSYKTTEIPCFGGKGICAKNCALGREHFSEYDTDCKSGNGQNMCCAPILPEDLAKISDLGAEVSVPLLYKKTMNNPDGVLGYLTIGVSKD